ncbi:hypothetical protein MKX03_036237, partial [Papaver bracteatum]
MLIKINVTSAQPRRVLVRAQEDEAWISVNYNVMPWRICQICRVLDHHVEPCVEGDVMIIEEPVNLEENGIQVEDEVILTCHNGHEDMSEYGISKAQINALAVEASRDSIEDSITKMGGSGESSKECNPNLTVLEVGNRSELELVDAQFVADAERTNEDNIMVEARNRIKGKAKVVLEKLKDKEKAMKEAEVIYSSGQLVIKDNIQVVDVDEADRRMDKATEHQNKESSLLGFTINLKEPERKKRKYKRKVYMAEDENVKKSKEASSVAD